MQLFIDIYGFLSVVLRGVILAAQSFAVGGLAFLLMLVWPLAPRLAGAAETLERRALRLIFISAVVLCAAEALAAAALTAMLAGTLEIPVGEAAGARAVAVDLMAGVIAAVIALAVWRAQRGGGAAIRSAAPVLAALLLGVQSGSTHAASQFEGAAALAAAEFLHMAGVAVWIGGLPFFLFALADVAEPKARATVAARFSAMSVCAVIALLGGGLLMAVFYVAAPEAMYGTSYGLMLGAKIVLFLGLLFLGGLNFLAVRALKTQPAGPLSRTRRFAETEIGVGLTVIFCAASLASLPPARDVPNDRASFAEIVDRLEPRLPVRLESPDFEALSAALPAGELQNPSSRAASRMQADIAWSEYNHHWAGVFVLVMGVMALLERLSRRLAPVMRHWPLVFIGLAGFLFLRADESVWPLGRLGLIESLRDPEIAQHRLLTLLIVAFGLFEWRVRLGRVAAEWAPYVFPISTATAAAFLLTHSHALANLKEETLIEITHTPLALVGVAAGWSRWLELRLDDGARKWAGLVWPVAFILAGLMLVFYREA